MFKLAAQKVSKTGDGARFDAMIYRITGLWVAFIGLACLFVTDLPAGFWSSRWGFAPEALQVI